jgi:hypothetical protein
MAPRTPRARLPQHGQEGLQFPSGLLRRRELSRVVSEQLMEPVIPVATRGTVGCASETDTNTRLDSSVLHVAAL